MASCKACDAELDTSVLEVGETVTCLECGADMEVVSVRPLELELLEEGDEEEDEGFDSGDDDMDVDEDDEEE